jgi:magnesium chelatase family protein
MAAQPCPCGFARDPVKDCTCAPSTITRYQKRISGPLIDRIDIHLEVPRIEYEKLADRRPGETSAKVRERVAEARARQSARFTSSNGNGTPLNSDMGPAEIQQYCRLDEAGDRLLKAAVQQLQLSARAYHRVLKLARTIADLSSQDHIQTSHLAEALQYRPREMG